MHSGTKQTAENGVLGYAAFRIFKLLVTVCSHENEQTNKQINKGCGTSSHANKYWNRPCSEAWTRGLLFDWNGYQGNHVVFHYKNISLRALCLSHRRTESSYLFNALHPVLNVLKGFLIGDVIHKDNTLTMEQTYESLVNELIPRLCIKEVVKTAF